MGFLRFDCVQLLGHRLVGCFFICRLCKTGGLQGVMVLPYPSFASTLAFARSFGHFRGYTHFRKALMKFAAGILLLIIIIFI